ncbi:2-C-methyl-D-erythritol 4-phosphate cytidylyltransferase [Acidiluteibacter ferrifornacis]|uniref:2-C-methyl-D-erythritol 4-phosphate cytidylyltransferase n=1 Tax=Acidiluteibacter ferrifornacis TaxID=2692424 RepID=A0A6N9NFG0_9FLAO|nr:2-C-methyl-D-erythritol 4-phosphate cytidylyltransferase [Acidiluteibacter ferrifornacis]NBG64613.1 2-C-methyl-D-erythritol 4-phosphate cytidylyltransferase [Acidiluteibacter ferrifornacis]
MKRFAIIVAGGKGNRMKSEIPKQFIEIGGKPILMHAIEQFYKADSNIEIILVLPKEQIQYWQELQTKHGFEVPVLVSEGGTSRFYSVKNGLEKVTSTGVVAIHDGVRPFVATSTIMKGFEVAEKEKTAIPTVNLVDSIRRVDEKVNRALNRADYRLVQTPQVFDIALLKTAYQQSFSDTFTDDASVIEAMGHSVTLFEGNSENFKITTPFDLKVAEMMVGGY